MNIDSLDTNIVKAVMNKYQDGSKPENNILKLLTICLNSNDFVFDYKHFLQVQGTTMWHCYTPAYANIYMSEWEQEALN